MTNSCVPIRDRWRSCRGPAEKHPNHHKAMAAIDGCWSRELSPLVVQLLRQSTLLRLAFRNVCRIPTMPPPLLYCMRLLPIQRGTGACV